MVAPALARITLGEDQEIDLHANIRVLLVDDDLRFLDTTQKYLEEDLGCTVHAVTETKEAINCLQQDSYDVVIADLNFDPPESIQGTQFIAENIKHMGDAKVVAVTGQAYYAFKTSRVLESLGVEVIDKGDDLFKDLTNIAADKVEGQRQVVAERIQAALSDIGPEAGVNVRTKGDVNIATATRTASPAFRKRPNAALERLYGELEGTLTRWLGSRSNRDQKSIVIGGSSVSINELIQHIEDGTELGLAQMDMLVKQFKQLLRLEDE